MTRLPLVRPAIPDSDSGTVATLSWPTVTEATDKLFVAFDTNADATITLAEISAVLDPGGHHPDGLNQVVQRVVGLIDTNDDGKLTKTEVTTALTKLDTNHDGVLSPADLRPSLAQDGLTPVLAALLAGGLPGAGNPPPPVEDHHAPSLDEVVNALIKRFDTNNDQGISLTELLAVLDPRAGHAKIDDAMQSLVTAVDTNQDGVMSAAEIKAAVASLDDNHDGLLNHDDHMPGPPSGDAVDLVGLLLPHLRDFDSATLGHFG
ncbi:EF-hand domain-containing protein [Aquabacterium sp.]|uniref:EF-hand domain-containing protein n=1 Tax=Aquabacterium sp. TaxID=1872578 RepID=UPI003784F4E7